MNLGDPELELIDPTPNVHNLFIQFDKLFFFTKLASRAVVRWSKRMYSCAGVCSYEGRGGLCDIALSEPLLKLRPRKDLVETLLHEMIHAYLFVTSRDQDRDGHGPNFQAHMHRINRSAGINITIYHDFHDEVRLYQTHIWRCNGVCQQRRPHFGIVRRPNNRAPGPTDYWWNNHKRNCGGTFIKIKEPENYVQRTKKAPPKPKGDITKYITSDKPITNINNNVLLKPILKDSNTMPTKTKSNGSNTLVINRKEPVFNPKPVINKPSVKFSDQGQPLPLADPRPRFNSVGVFETVRNVWANKQLPTNPNSAIKKQTNTANTTIHNKTSKHKIESSNNSPPAKVAKIDDYFKTTATSVLKELYGQDFQISQNKDKKIVATSSSNSTGPDSLSKKTDVSPFDIGNLPVNNFVACPVCSTNVCSRDINRHLDECLNKEAIKIINKDNAAAISTQASTSVTSNSNLRDIVGDLPTIPPFKRRIPSIDNIRESIDNSINEKIITSKGPLLLPPVRSYVDLINIQQELNTAIIDFENEIKVEDSTVFASNIKEANLPKEKTNNLASNDICVLIIETPKIKVEPGTSNTMPQTNQKCACCGKIMDKPIEEHLDECLAFFDNNDTIPQEGVSTSRRLLNEVIVIDDDNDIFDESQIFNATGTKSPCPCCLDMIEELEMNDHLDRCLSGK